MAQDEQEHIPAIGSVWRHRNGILYTVYDITNRASDRPKYPLRISYRGENGNTWSRDFSDWNRSMTLVSAA